MKNIEEAYKVISTALLSACSKSTWKCLQVDAPVLGKNLGGTVTIQKLSDGSECDIPIGWGVFDIQKAALFLRDNILATTGQRIWGLTFTLYPDGKFNIEYDYNKPADYEETDEVITGDEINQNLSSLK